MSLCGICNEKEGSYTCSRCNIAYCSIACFKHKSHTDCSEKLYQSQVEAELKNMGDHKLDVEEKKRLTDLFKRMADFGIEFEEETTDDSEENPLEALAEIDSDVDEAKLEAILGAEMFERFRDFIEKDASELTWTPWWKTEADDENVLVQEASSKRGAQPKPLIPKDIPSFRSISRTQPSEFLWNNLFEILFLYTYSMNLYLGDLEGSRPEVIEAMLQVSGILSGKAQKYDSTPQAITSAMSNIRQNPTMNNPDIFSACCLKELIVLIREPSNALHAVCHLRRLFEDVASPSKDVFLASKKLLYYSSWLHSELTDNQDLVDEIFSSVVVILGGIHDRLLGKHTN